MAEEDANGLTLKDRMEIRNRDEICCNLELVLSAMYEADRTLAIGFQADNIMAMREISQCAWDTPVCKASLVERHGWRRSGSLAWRKIAGALVEEVVKESRECCADDDERLLDVHDCGTRMYEIEGGFVKFCRKIEPT
ncbi:hypothetical protein R1sor_025425 [Riccia sorocarpa]|uniref:Uncharacterized protein n=1 Tax=Riccia sorocarpa TaxID=122646 RepID=A0ABD3GA51_9MARC